jgi:ribulose-5-phosphate 4-epimerase/fuculose-1-phosphate aldolase
VGSTGRLPWVTEQNQEGVMNPPENEREARIELAAAFRIAVQFDFHEGISNHFSMLVPGADDRFLINPFGLHFSEVTASSLAVVGVDGTPISGTAPDTGIGIHSPIHRLCPQAAVVLHTHQPWTTALAMQEELHLAPISQTSLQFTDRVVYEERYEGLADLDEGERLAKALGTDDVMFLRHHGILVAGRELGVAIDDLYMLEKAAQLQVLAGGLGTPTPIAPETIDRTRGQFTGQGMLEWGRMHWAALLRMLEKTQPDFKD